MDDFVTEIEDAKRLPLVKLGLLFVSAVAALTTLVTAWDNLLMRAISIVLLGILVVYALERGIPAGPDGRRRRWARLARHLGSLLTGALVIAGLIWTWGVANAPDLSIDHVRVGQLPDGGGSVLVALDGGTRADLVTGMTVMTALQLEACGGAQFESITVAPVLALSSREDGGVVVSGEQESSRQPGAGVRITGGMNSDHCGDVSWLTLRPQQPIQAGGLDQVLVEVPGAFEITSSVSWSDTQATPVEEILDGDSFEVSPGYEDYLRTILPGQSHPLLGWPWTFDRAELAAAGYRAVLLVAAESSGGECVTAAVDLMEDDTPRLDAEQTSMLLSSGSIGEHLPPGCT